MNALGLSPKLTYWIYALSEKSWEEYDRYLDSAKTYHLGSYKHFNIGIDDIIIFYKKGKYNGFVAVANASSETIDNKSYNISIYRDRNINRFCVKIDTIISFDSIKLIDIDNEIKNSYGYNNQKSFTKKHLDGELELKQIRSELGYNIALALLNYSPEDKQKQPTKKHDHKQDQKQPDLQTNILNQNNETNNETNNNKNKGSIPILIELCDQMNAELGGCEYNEETVVVDTFNHIKKCKVCNIVDNGNCMMNIDIAKIKWRFHEISNSDDEYNDIIDSYLNLTEYYNQNGQEGIDLNMYYISEEDSMYGKCVVINHNKN